MPNFPKFKQCALAVTMIASLGMGSAQAVTASSFITSGYNVVEDDSNEYIFRATDNGYSLILGGPILVGDVLLQMFDFPIINGVNIDSLGGELSGVALNVVTTVTPNGTYDVDGPGPAPSVNVVNINFGAASAAEWLALTGVNLGSLGFTTTGLISLLFDDPSNNLDVYSDSYANLGQAMDGTLLMALALGGGGDYLYGGNVPADIDTFLPSVGEVEGVTQYGTFSYQLSVAFESLGGDIIGKVSGTGTNLVTDRATIAAVIDDTQASFNYVPEPGSLALLGGALLGMAFARRRSHS